MTAKKRLPSKPKADPEAFFESLSPVTAGSGNYTATDQYRDFRRVFGSPEGRRVLWQIMDLCKTYAPVADVNNVNTTFLREGRRQVGVEIMRILRAEPLPDLADTAISQKPKE